MIPDSAKGVLAMVLACSIWGFSPVFYKQLVYVPALDVLAHRMIWSLVFFALVLALQNRLGDLKAALGSLRAVMLTICAALMVSANWVMFIWAVQTGQTTQSALGYYIYPLIAVLIGRLVFAEKLAAMQWGAVGLAALAVLVLTVGFDTLPTLALAMATTFGIYGMLKKRVVAGPVVSVTAEVVVLTPIAVLMLLRSYQVNGVAFGGDLPTAALLVLSGPVTALPLIFFSSAARRLAMSTLGLLQYLNPTLQFICAVFIFAEPFSGWHLMGFALIWAALVLYSTVAWRQDKARRTAARQVAASGRD